MQGISVEQDYLCRCLGTCLYGEGVDSEIGDLINLPVPGPSWFSYVRYNQSFLGDEAQRIQAQSRSISKLDAVDGMPPLRETGRKYAGTHVALEHFI